MRDTRGPCGRVGHYPVERYAQLLPAPPGWRAAHLIDGKIEEMGLDFIVVVEEFCDNCALQGKNSPPWAAREQTVTFLALDGDRYFVRPDEDDNFLGYLRPGERAEGPGWEAHVRDYHARVERRKKENENPSQK